MLNGAPAPTRRMLVDSKGLGKPPVFSGGEEDFYVWANKVENHVSGMFPNVRGVLAFAVESQDVITAAAVALGVPGLGAGTSTEIEAQLFVVLSALTVSESFDVVMSAGGDRGFESWRKLHGRYDPYTAGSARRLWREILSPTRMKLSELMGAIERMEDLVRRHCSRRDDQVNAHTLAEDIRMSSHEALLPDDLEKHVQMNRASLNSYSLLREEIKTYCEYREAMRARERSRKVHHIQEETTQRTLVLSAKTRASRAKASTARAKAKDSKDSKDSKDKDGKDGTRARVRWNVGTVDSADISRKTVGARMTTKVEENTRRLRRTLTILTRRNHRKETIIQELKLVDFTCVPSMQLTKCERLKDQDWS